MTSLAGTNLASFQYFSGRVKTHRTEVIEYIRFKTNGFSLPSYFTPSKEGEWEEYKRMGREWVEKKIPKTPRYHVAKQGRLIITAVLAARDASVAQLTTAA